MITARRPLLLAAALLLSAGLSACAGENCFTGPGCVNQGAGGDTTAAPTAADSVAPTVQFTVPTDSAVAAVGDSIFVQVRVQDNAALAQVKLEGYVMRGDPKVTEPLRVERYGVKTVDLTPAKTGRPVRDTTIGRFLVATPDSLPERGVLVVATAVDTAGRQRTDTIRVGLGGPRVQIVTPASGLTHPVGTPLPVRLTASDATDLIRTITLRATGAFSQEVVVTLATPRASVDTTVFINPTAQGAVQLAAFTTSGANLPGASRPVDVVITPPGTDRAAPRVTFTVQAPQRAQVLDSLRVRVSATDEVGVDSVGATVLFRFRDPATGAQRSVTLTQRVRATSDTLRFSLAPLGIAQTDTTTVSAEVTAWATDAAGNCGAAITPGSVQSLACVTTGGAHFAQGFAGRLETILIVRGVTIAPAGTGNVLADLASDGTRVFASNFSRNQLEVLPVVASGFGAPVSVGSQPWGLAVGVSRDTLFVANSGGTNISAVRLTGGPAEEVRRIRTPDMELYDVTYDVQADTASVVAPVDYSDRPQFLGQVRTGQLLYSTRPTRTRADGTVRIYDPGKDTTYAFNRGPEIFTGYASPVKGQAIIANALSAELVSGGRITVCPRRVSPTGADPACVTGRPSNVSAALTALRQAGATDTRLDLGVGLATVGLSDTTFVAVSTDHSTVAFGEGVRSPGRILRFESRAGGALIGSSRQSADLVGNAAERVIGLALNGDGSLGVARGQEVYYFSSDLRLEGGGVTAGAGLPSGGSAMHPFNTGYPGDDGRRLSFVSGQTAEGLPFIDVVNTRSFRVVRRLFLREAITGALIAVPVQAGDIEASTFVLRLFGITQNGVVRIGLTAADLQP